MRQPPPPPPPPIVHVYQPTQLKKESPPPLQEEEDWYDQPKATKEPATLVESGDNKKIKRKKEMSHYMEQLNQDFLQNIEGLYLSKLNSINHELKEAHQDTHTFYLDNIRDLEAMRQKMIEDGQLFREYQKQVTENQFRLEIYQAEEEYTAETQEIREKLFTVLEEKRRKLKEDKDNCDLAYDLVMDTQARLHKRNLRKRGPENPDSKSNKKKHLNGPSLVFKLKDDDILSDMQAMRNVR
ncbi:Sds3-like-domain-containing protein [Blakeslea trispora]|nr:Sds3-like-domain-containing protein [Blakeslea trispora]